MRLIVVGLLSAIGASSVPSPTCRDATLPTSDHLASKKSVALDDPSEAPALLGTIVQTHTGEHVMLDDASPAPDRWAELLADRVTGQHHAIDPRLLDVLRQLARAHQDPLPHIEIVSGYRSAKLNEMLRKKGHHVASHSQHSLGNAVDFRMGDLSPLDVERELRAPGIGWSGGIGVYLSQADWFTHADVGPMRRWNGL
jgi:uncharacterized protein YcbK (DUF882 family)